eukprot:850531-Prorocentrum_minimum.AAC.1
MFAPEEEEEAEEEDGVPPPEPMEVVDPAPSESDLRALVAEGSCEAVRMKLLKPFRSGCGADTLWRDPFAAEPAEPLDRESLKVLLRQVEKTLHDAGPAGGEEAEEEAAAPVPSGGPSKVTVGREWRDAKAEKRKKKKSKQKGDELLTEVSEAAKQAQKRKEKVWIGVTQTNETNQPTNQTDR